MIVSLKNGFIFFKPMKVAGSSLEAALSTVCGPNDLLTGPSQEDKGAGTVSTFISQNNTDDNGCTKFHSHTNPYKMFKVTGTDWPGFFIISCIRNPWDLCVSYYWWSVQKLFLEKGIDPLTVSWEASGMSTLPALVLESDSTAVKSEKFKQFLLSTWMGSQSCIDFISSETESFIHERVNYYIRFENLQEDFSNLSTVLDKDFPPLPSLKSGYRNKSIKYQDFYSAETSRLIERMFPKSVQLGYSF